MNGLRLISSVAVLFFLLRASFCTAIEERSPKSAREPVKKNEFPYLALVKFGDDTFDMCSGSILSKSTVLTYCTCNANDTALYAGVVYVGHVADPEYPMDKIQIRQVKRVAEHPQEKDLKIFYVNETWEWTDNVTFITLYLNEERPSVETCQVLGFGVGDAYKMEQKIGGSSECYLNDTTPGLLYSKTDTIWETLYDLDRGGPVLCQGKQRAINAKALKWVVTPEPTEPPAEGGNEPSYTDNLHCNTYLDIAFYRSWILDNIKDFPSSVDSIHRFSVKISMNQALLYASLWLLLIMTVELLYLS